LTGHRNSYDKGVLHRDISLGNILITGKEDPGNRGVLIDYDNAIRWKNHKPLPDDGTTVCRIGIILQNTSNKLLRARGLSYHRNCYPGSIYLGMKLSKVGVRF
jgi:serine/threonine protein kinase